MHAVLHWLAHVFLSITGANNQGTIQYGSWSGWVPCLGLLTVAAGVWKHVNCHAPGCWWVGRYPTEGGEFKLCHRHHPEHDGKKPTLDDIHHRHHVRKASTIRNR